MKYATSNIDVFLSFADELEKVAHLSKLSGADDLTAAIAGAVAGGAVGNRIVQSTGGRYALPVGLATSLMGSHITGSQYAKMKRRRRIKKRREQMQPVIVQSPGSTTPSGRRLSHPTRREVYDEYSPKP